MPADSATRSTVPRQQRSAIRSPWDRGFWRCTPRPGSALGSRRRGRRRALLTAISGCAAAATQQLQRQPVRDVDENIAVARFANALYRYSGTVGFRKVAQRAMRYLASPQLADGQRLRTGILLADAELGGAPTHVTIVGHKDDASAQALHSAALRYPSVYRRVDWWDKREGAMPNPDVRYPELARAAAFICTCLLYT